MSAAKKQEMPKGFNCTACNKWHDFGFYVAAHWNDELTHTCDCKAKHVVCRGVAAPIACNPKERGGK